MRPSTVQIRQRGTVTLPAKLRAKYRLGEGDVLTILDLGGTILLSPKISVVGKLAAEIEQHRKAAGLELEDLFGSHPSGRVRRGISRRRR